MDEEQPLTQAELHAIRQLLEADRRAAWLWSGVRAVALWLSGVIAAAVLLWDTLKKVVRAMVE